MNERIKLIRATLKLSQKEFGDKIGLKSNSISDIENGKNGLRDQVFISICREFNVNEEWLRSGEGEMFNKLLEEDEMAKYVEELLYDAGSDSVYNLIKSVMRTYNKLDDKSQEVIRNSIDLLLEDIKKEG